MAPVKPNAYWSGGLVAVAGGWAKVLPPPPPGTGFKVSTTGTVMPWVVMFVLATLFGAGGMMFVGQPVGYTMPVPGSGQVGSALL